MSTTWPQIVSLTICGYKVPTIKPGGLNSRDQSRLRSRFLDDMSRQTLKNCQDFLNCQDKLLFVSVEICKIETETLLCQDFWTRLLRTIETVKTNWDPRAYPQYSPKWRICGCVVDIWKDFFLTQGHLVIDGSWWRYDSILKLGLGTDDIGSPVLTWLLVTRN